MDVKSELKSARDCIKQKEYKSAIKHCKVFFHFYYFNHNYIVISFIGGTFGFNQYFRFVLQIKKLLSM